MNDVKGSAAIVAAPTLVAVVPQPTEETETAAPAGEKIGSVRMNLRMLNRSVLAILVVLVLGVCYAAQEVLIPLILALLLSLLLSPVVTLLQRARIPRALASMLVLFTLVGTFAGGIMILAQPARDWVANAPATIATIEQRFRSLREPIRQAQEASRKIEDLTTTGPAPQATVVSTQPSLLSSMATSTPHVLGSIAAVLILVYFFLSSGNSFLRRMVEIAPKLREKKVVVSIAREVQDEMSRYLLTVSAINFCLGLATAALMQMLGIPNPLLWGTVATILNFVPYVGPATTGIALLVAGFTSFDSIGQALSVPGAFFLLAFLEGQLITPTIIGRRLALDPTVVFIWLLLWGWLWGVVGILLAGPLIACFRIFCQHVDALHSVAILIGDGSMSEAASKKAAAGQ